MWTTPIDILTKGCACDKTPTLPVILFELFVIVAVILLLAILSKISKDVLKKFFLVAVGIFIFELFTAPMWNNEHLGNWAYVYMDVSWVLTIGWSILILSTVLIIDKLFSNSKEWLRFIYYLTFLTFSVLIFESLVIKLGIRSYAPEVLEAIGGLYIPLLDVPLKALYYVPAFTSLVIALYKYWNFILEKEPVAPQKKGKWLRNLMISFIAVFAFELMIDPMVVNAKLPSWSYVYRDISILMTGLWILLIWLATNIVDRLFLWLDLSKRFILYLITITIVMLPLEAWFINNGYRVYGPSAMANFSGFQMVITRLPIEVAFAIPLYLALVVSFIRYWAIILDNRK